jgi:hypothetical protein
MTAETGLIAREEYACDSSGNLRVTISVLPSRNTRAYEIGQLASQ